MIEREREMKLLRFFRLPSLCLCSFVSWFSFPSLPVAMDASCSYTPLPFHSLPRLLLLLPPPPPSFSSSQCALFCCVPLIPRPLRILADSTTSHFHNLPTRVRVSQRIGQSSPVRAVPVQVAHELLNAGHRFLDVRTAEEFAQGHIEGAVNIPYMYKVGSGLSNGETITDGCIGDDDSRLYWSSGYGWRLFGLGSKWYAHQRCFKLKSSSVWVLFKTVDSFTVS